MRIILATDSFPPQINGVADTAARISGMLATRGHDVGVLAPGPGRARIRGVAIHRLWSISLPLYPHVRLSLLPHAVLQSIRRRPPDATIVVTPGPVGLAIASAIPRNSRLINIYSTDTPYYLRAYGLPLLRPPAERTLRWLSVRASVTLCPTEVIRRRLAASGYPRLAVWGRGVDTTLFCPDRRSDMMRHRLTGGEVSKPLVLYAGRLAREKRLLDLYEAARRLSGARFALVGDGPQRDLLERRFASVPSVFTGFLRGATLAAAYASSDLFVFPSDSETFGQVVLQAMASGLPAVVVRGTAPAEFVRGGISGLHVPPRSPEALAHAIQALLADEGTRRRMADVAVIEAKSYSWDSLLDTLEDYLFGRTPVPASTPAADSLRSCG